MADKTRETVFLFFLLISVIVGMIEFQRWQLVSELKADNKDLREEVRDLELELSAFERGVIYGGQN